MTIENLISIIPALTGLVYVTVGFISLKFPPQKINSFFGYRTSSSIKSKERWDFAQRTYAKEMIKLGILLAISGLIVSIYLPNEIPAMFIGIGLIITVVIALIINVELAIKKKFNAN